MFKYNQVNSAVTAARSVGWLGMWHACCAVWLCGCAGSTSDPGLGPVGVAWFCPVVTEQLCRTLSPGGGGGLYAPHFAPVARAQLFFSVVVVLLQSPADIPPGLTTAFRYYIKYLGWGLQNCRGQNAPSEPLCAVVVMGGVGSTLVSAEPAGAAAGAHAIRQHALPCGCSLRGSASQASKKGPPGGKGPFFCIAVTASH